MTQETLPTLREIGDRIARLLVSVTLYEGTTLEDVKDDLKAIYEMVEMLDCETEEAATR